MKLIKERMESREQETLGKWLTESALKKLNKFTAQEVKSIIGYCRKFPESLVRLDGVTKNIWASMCTS
jgi:acyl-CoA reductase-like NAD-dependent aldehyde dehydrogenase